MKEGNYKDGKQEGLETNWYSNERKKAERNFKNDILVTAVVWKINGEKGHR